MVGLIMATQVVTPSAQYPVDKRLPTPAYLQLKEAITKAIHSSELPPGAALPSERDLALSLGLSRMTVRRAFEELVAESLVEQRQGSGTYVRERRLEQTVDRLLSFTREAEVLGFTPGSRLLGHGWYAADQAVADELRVAKGTRVLRFTRLRTADDGPLAIQIAHLSPDLEDFPLERLAAGESLYAIIAERYGMAPHHARQTVKARLPNKEERRLLELPRDVPLLALDRTTFDEAGRPFEFVRSAYRSDRYQMAFVLKAASVL